MANTILGKPKAIMEAKALANCAMEAYSGCRSTFCMSANGICIMAATKEKLMSAPAIMPIPVSPKKRAILIGGLISNNWYICNRIS